ncbi:MAG: hypothetical protein WBA39_07300 [Rivularia sp. (in: cyanobacteria)]
MIQIKGKVSFQNHLPLINDCYIKYEANKASLADKITWYAQVELD